MPSVNENHFVERVSRYPLVTDTYGKVTDYYSWAKNKNTIVNSGLNITESVLYSAVSKAQPVINRFERPIATIDQFSCRQLDKLEEKFPIILEPTDQIVDKSKEVYETAVKQRVHGVIQPVVAPVMNTVSNVQYGVSKVTEKTSSMALSVCHTRGGQMVLSQLNNALDLADRSIDRYLPEESVSEKESTKVDELKNSNVEAPITRALSLTNKVRRRMYLRAMKDLNKLRLRSEESIKKMTHSVDLIAYARDRIDCAKNYTFEIEAEWRDALLEVEADLKMQTQGVNESDDFSNNQTMPNKESSSTDRIMESAKYWAHRLRIATAATYLVTYRNLPEHIQEKLQTAQSFSVRLYETLSKSSQVSDLKESFVDHARDIISDISVNLETAFDFVKESRVFSLLYPNRPTEAIEMQSLEIPSSDSESEEKDDCVRSSVDIQQPQIPLIQISPSPYPQDSVQEDSLQSADSLQSENMPLVSDDELE